VGGEIQIADAIDGEAQSGRVRAYEIEAATRRDLGEPGLYAAAIIADED
jgi:UTP-glucose-1-phosphate uridylyltransferase